MPNVTCSVANCEYWATDNKCGADMIMIDIDAHATKKFNTEFAGEGFDTEHQDHTNSSSNTCCHTFKRKQA
ncbi:MAG: DUF1540 domain-containing protein [Paenibacillaceae bacterium]